MLGFRPHLYWKICWRYISPGLIIIIFIASIVNLAINPMQYSAWDKNKVSSLSSLIILCIWHTNKFSPSTTVLEIRKKFRFPRGQMQDNQALDFGCPDENLVALNVFYDFCLVVGFDQTNITHISMPLFS